MTQTAPVADTGNETKPYTVSHTLVNVYLTLMFSFFPLFLTEQYAHARTDKFWLYLILTAVLVISVVFSSTMRKLGDKKHTKPKGALQSLSTTDILMLCFVGFAAISTITSPYIFDAFTGFKGRDNGLLLLTAYALMYFIITRNYRYKDYAFVGYLVVSSIVALLTVINYFYIDPLNIFSGYGEDTIVDFGSTIGNKNIIAAFMCMFLPVAVGFFTVTEKRYMRILSGFAIIFAYPGILCADSSSNILGLLVILPIMLIIYCRSYTYLKRFFGAMTILFISGKLLHLFAILVGNKNKGFEVFQQFLIYSPLMFIPIIICGAIFLLLYFLGKNGEPRYPAKTLQITLKVLFGVSIVTLLGAFFYFSVIDRETDLGDYEKLLRFSDAWGTHRGFMWRISFEEYGKFNFWQKLFGAGPDTAYNVLEPHFKELAARFGDSSTDCAHNELINYLLTQGALGLAAYLGLIVTALVRGLKTARKNPLTLIFMGAVLCYLVQSTVNLYNPIVTPHFFIFLTLTEAISRSTSTE